MFQYRKVSCIFSCLLCLFSCSPLHISNFVFLDFSLQMKRVMESDAALTEDLVAYNIIPLDAPLTTNPVAFLPEVFVDFTDYLFSDFLIFIVSWCQVRAAISSLKYYRGLPKLPSDFRSSSTRRADLLDFLQFVFGFQVSNSVWPMWVCQCCSFLLFSPFLGLRDQIQLFFCVSF